MQREIPDSLPRATIRVASVGYLNSTPYQSLREEPWISFGEYSPAECARRFFEKECDFALLPVVDGVTAGDCTLLGFGIAARAEVESVLLLAEQPLESLDAIALDTSSHTSVILLRTLLAQRFPGVYSRMKFFRTEPAALSKAIGGNVGALVIGDLALQLRSVYPRRYDLAQLWREHTGFPFVFAVWAAREQPTDTVAAFGTAVERALQRPSSYVRSWALQHGVNSTVAERYVRDRISYRLGTNECRGLNEFIRRAAGIRLLPSARLRREVLPGRDGRRGVPIFAAKRRSAEDLLARRIGGRRLAIADVLEIREKVSLSEIVLAAGEVACRERHSPPLFSELVFTNSCALRYHLSPLFRAPGQMGGWVLSADAIRMRIAAMRERGALGISLRGGVNPEYGLSFYEELFSALRGDTPLRALSADEVSLLAQESKVGTGEILMRLREAGLSFLGDAAFAPLLDGVRKRMRQLPTSEAWHQIHREAHTLGIQSTATLPIGGPHLPRDLILHLQKVRQLQDELGSIHSIVVEFAPSAQEMEVLNVSEVVRYTALARLFLDNITSFECFDSRPHSFVSQLGDLMGPGPSLKQASNLPPGR